MWTMQGLMGVTSMCLLLITVVSLSTAAADDDDGALVTVEVEDENNTNVEVIVDSAKPKRSAESFIDPKAEPFIPTNEWQVVKPGQSIPSGLHIRMNFSSGTREAKLMEGDDGTRYKKNRIEGGTQTTTRLKHLKERFEETMKGVDTEKVESGLKYWKQDGKQGILNTNKDHFSRSELKEALKHFKTTSDDPKIKKFRTASELKHALKDLKLDMKSDLEVMEKLLHQYEKITLAEEKTFLLEELEWLVHQIDNAQYLADSGGLLLVANDLNSTESAVRQAAAYVIGSAVQSNPKVQVAVMKTNMLTQLIQMMTIFSESKTQNKALYAISTLVRHFPSAQQTFVEGGGLQVLTNILTNGDDSKLKVKVVTLLTDLITKKKKVPTATLR